MSGEGFVKLFPVQRAAPALRAFLKYLFFHGLLLKGGWEHDASFRPASAQRRPTKTQKVGFPLLVRSKRSNFGARTDGVRTARETGALFPVPQADGAPAVVETSNPPAPR